MEENAKDAGGGGGVGWLAGGRRLLFMAAGESAGLQKEAEASIAAFVGAGFEVAHAADLAQAVPSLTRGDPFRVVVAKLGSSSDGSDSCAQAPQLTYLQCTAVTNLLWSGRCPW